MSIFNFSTFSADFASSSNSSANSIIKTIHACSIIAHWCVLKILILTAYHACFLSTDWLNIMGIFTSSIYIVRSFIYCVVITLATLFSTFVMRLLCALCSACSTGQTSVFMIGFVGRGVIFVMIALLGATCCFFAIVSALWVAVITAIRCDSGWVRFHAIRYRKAK